MCGWRKLSVVQSAPWYSPGFNPWTVLYAMYILPLFDLEFILAFADDNFIPRFNTSMDALSDGMKNLLIS
jgi:hypothetical protein